MKKKVALAQMCSGIDPAANASALSDLVEKAAQQGADILFTPEMTGLVDKDRRRAANSIVPETEDITLLTAKEAAQDNNIWINIGSLAVQNPGGELWLNRSYLINPSGDVVDTYDKIHLFDVDLDTGESWRESSAYAGGNKAVTADFEGMKLGLSICYDLRFSKLYAALSESGVDAIAVPSAFTVPTGKAHWEILLRARAIETASFVFAAAQCGKHEDGRETFGHSMVVDPWGNVLLDMGTDLGIATCEINLELLEEVRRNIPVLANRKEFGAPNKSMVQGDT